MLLPNGTTEEKKTTLETVETASLKSDDATAIRGQEPWKQNWPCSLAWEGWHALSSLSITVTLANHIRL